jgi:hypothetical protein
MLHSVLGVTVSSIQSNTDSQPSRSQIKSHRKAFSDAKGLRIVNLTVDMHFSKDLNCTDEYFPVGARKLTSAPCTECRW